MDELHGEMKPSDLTLISLNVNSLPCFSGLGSDTYLSPWVSKKDSSALSFRKDNREWGHGGVEHNTVYITAWNYEVVVVQLLSHVRLFATHGLQRTRLPCPSLTPGVCSNSCPLSRWCHTTISSSVAPFSSCPQSFPASGSFPISRHFTSDGQLLELHNQSFQWIFRVDFL